MNKVKKCTAKEAFLRMNYLYQVSNNLVNSNVNNNCLGVDYLNLLVNISKKSVQRIDIDIKRTICKGCRSLLIPGLNTKVRVRRKNIIWMCTVCNTRKNYKARPGYTPWTQTSDAVANILDYS